MEDFSIHQVERLANIFNQIRFQTPDEMIVAPTKVTLDEIKQTLNAIFPNSKCLEVKYTSNHDKLFFGIRVNPQITKGSLINIIMTNDKKKLDNYKIEFDSKLLAMGLDPLELAAYTIYEVSTMVDSYKTIDDLRILIDTHMAVDDDCFYIRESVHYAQLVIYAVKEALTCMTSLLFKNSPEEYLDNNVIQTANLEQPLINAHEVLTTSESGLKDSFRRGNIGVLQWMFTIYRDMATNSGVVMEQLKDYKEITGSQLDIEEINKTLESLDRINNSLVTESTSKFTTLNEFFEQHNIGSINEFSIFSGLKRNGLRSIEDSLYEFAMQIKNLETEEDAIYVMRGINSRMAILQDYLYNSPDISESERRHYEKVLEQFRKLREDLVRKKIWNRKQYGLFFDYDQFDEETNISCPSCSSNLITVGEGGQCTCCECGNTFSNVSK